MSFNTSNNNYLVYDFGSPGLTLPLSVAFWGWNQSANTGDWATVSLTDRGSGASYNGAVLYNRAYYSICYWELDSSSHAAIFPDSPAITSSAGQKWEFLAGVSNDSGTAHTAYANGLPGTTSASTCIPTGLRYLEIGRYWSSAGSAQQNSAVCYVAVWNDSLTSGEIAALYNQGAGMDPRQLRGRNLIGFWSLRSNLWDYSGNGRPTEPGTTNSVSWFHDPQITFEELPRRFWRPQWSSAPAGQVDSSPLSAARPWIFLAPAGLDGQAALQQWAWSYAGILAGGEAGVTFPPDPVTVIATSVAPTVVLGSVTVPPDALTAVAATVNPTVVLGSVIVPPAALSAVAATVNPTVVLGSVTVPPDPATAVAATVNPTVVLGSVTVPPDPVSAVAATVNPTVLGGGVTYSPDAVTVVGVTVNPTVILGSVIVPPAALSAVAATINPTVLITGGVIFLTPDPVVAIAATIGPSVVQSSITYIPQPVTAIAATVSPTVDDGGELIIGVTVSAVASTYGPFVFSALGAETALMSRVVPRDYEATVIPRDYETTVIPRHTGGG